MKNYEDITIEGYQIQVIENKKSKYGWTVLFWDQGEKPDACYIEQKSKDGYLRVYTGNSYYAKVCKGKPVYLHRLIFAYLLHYPLNLFGMEVHHLDHNKLNNSLENLVLLSKEEHKHLHDLERQGLVEEAEIIKQRVINIRENRLKCLTKN